MNRETPELLDLLRDIFKYDPESGKLYHKFRTEEVCLKLRLVFRVVSNWDTWNKKYAGRVIGQKRADGGYVPVRVLGELLYLHRIVFAIVHGRWPDEEIDHRNRKRGDNRIENIREATPSQNMVNRKSIRKEYTSYRGVYFGKTEFYSQIQFEGVLYRLGSFSSELEAAKAYDKAAKDLHGEFAILNFPEEQPASVCQPLRSGAVAGTMAN